MLCVLGRGDILNPHPSTPVHQTLWLTSDSIAKRSTNYYNHLHLTILPYSSFSEGRMSQTSSSLSTPYPLLPRFCRTPPSKLCSAQCTVSVLFFFLFLCFTPLPIVYSVYPTKLPRLEEMWTLWSQGTRLKERLAIPALISHDYRGKFTLSDTSTIKNSMYNYHNTLTS